MDIIPITLNTTESFGIPDAKFMNHTKDNFFFDKENNMQIIDETNTIELDAPTRK